MVWKNCLYCCCPCLKRKKLEESTGLTLGLLNGGKWSPRNKHVPLQQLYQVHKVPRFGRAKSNDDDVASSYGDEQKSSVASNSEKSKDPSTGDQEDSTEASAKHKKRWSKALALSRVKKTHGFTNPGFSSSTVKIKHDDKCPPSSPVEKIEKEKELSSPPSSPGPSSPQVVTSDGEYDEEECLSREVKHKTRWGRALLGIKKQSATKRLLGTSMIVQQVSTCGQNQLVLPPVTVASVSSPDIVTDLMNEENEARDCLGNNLASRHEPDAYSLLSPFTCNWIKSQSMQTVIVQGPSENDLSQDIIPEESESDKVARQHGLDPNLYRVNINLAKSTEAIDKALKTIVEASPESQFIDMSYGTVQFTAIFDETKKKLLVHVEKLEALAPKGKERSSYPCVMKLCILPFPKSVKTSKVTIDAANMFVNEYFHFGVKDVGGEVLRISVYDVAYQGMFDAIGHALFYLEDLSVEPHSMKLYQQATPDVNPGLVQLSLQYNCETEYLNVTVVKASCLNSIPTKSRVFLKVSQVYNNKKLKEQKYPSIPYCDEDVEFNTCMEFRIPSNFSAKHNHVIAIRLKVKNAISKTGSTLGYIVLGPTYYAEDGSTLTPWGRALLRNETVMHTFRLVM